MNIYVNIKILAQKYINELVLKVRLHCLKWLKNSSQKSKQYSGVTLKKLYTFINVFMNYEQDFLQVIP